MYRILQFLKWHYLRREYIFSIVHRSLTIDEKDAIRGLVCNIIDINVILEKKRLASQNVGIFVMIWRQGVNIWCPGFCVLVSFFHHISHINNGLDYFHMYRYGNTQTWQLTNYRELGNGLPGAHPGISVWGEWL